jgi:hypothetical protein
MNGLERLQVADVDRLGFDVGGGRVGVDVAAHRRAWLVASGREPLFGALGAGTIGGDRHPVIDLPGPQPFDRGRQVAVVNHLRLRCALHDV